MPGNIRLWGTTGYVELAAPNTAANEVLTLPTDSVQPGLVLVTAQSFTSASSIAVNNCFSTRYTNYCIVTSFTNTGGAITFRFRSGGSDNTASTYSSNATYMTNWTGAIGLHGVASGTAFTLNGSGSARMTLNYTIYEPFVATPTAMNGTWNEDRGGFGFSGYHNTASSFDGFNILGTGMTGAIRVFGYRNS